jgi:hypothetical protein
LVFSGGWGYSVVGFLVRDRGAGGLGLGDGNYYVGRVYGIGGLWEVGLFRYEMDIDGVVLWWCNCLVVYFW